MQKYTVEINSNGTIRWYKEGTSILHREGGPAVEFANGEKHWYKNGKFHRTDGPALEWIGGENHWLIEGVEYTEAEFNKITAKDNCDGKEVIFEGKTYKLSLVDKN